MFGDIKGMKNELVFIVFTGCVHSSSSTTGSISLFEGGPMIAHGVVSRFEPCSILIEGVAPIGLVRYQYQTTVALDETNMGIDQIFARHRYFPAESVWTAVGARVCINVPDGAAAFGEHGKLTIDAIALSLCHFGDRDQ